MRKFAPVADGPNAAALQVLAEQDSEVRATLFGRIVEQYPQAAMVFPEGATEVPQVLVDATSFTLAATQESESAGAAIPEATLIPLREWALDLRRTGFPASEFPAVAEIVGGVVGVDTQVLVRAAREMERVSREADEAGVPAASVAQVTSVAQDGSAWVVRAEASAAVGYAAGQALPVMRAGNQGVWWALAPAVPPNRFGQLEFHLDGPDVQVGDYLTLGAARGPAVRANRPKMLLVAVGTGWAAAKSVVFGLIEERIRPEVHLVLCGDNADDFYDTRTINSLADSQVWLQVTRVAPTPGEFGESSAKAIWVPGSAFVSAPGTWWDHQIVLCGKGAEVAEYREALEAAGASGILTCATDAAVQFPTA